MSAPSTPETSGSNMPTPTAPPPPENTTITLDDAKGTFSSWTQTLKYKTGLGITPEEKKQYEAEQKISQCRKCEEYVNFNMHYSPTVVFMLQQIENLGEEIPRGTIPNQRPKTKTTN
ncbi:unnamed protein product [Ambrosiozyma monospora]|uniref:Unnamed protein product n=1 Tax=Ambrosiozyma monospora TaxID=43982 RepID=A0A9W6YUK3_AMBMO|nr:unnamed protein product [Ambrosiozyma monospora]